MNETTPQIIGIVALLIIVYSVYDLFTFTRLSLRQKVNALFMILVLPAVGSLLYFLMKRSLLQRTMHARRMAVKQQS